MTVIQKKSFLKKRKAFALVLSLALMGFMVLLIVTLATMVQMQLRLSRNTMNDFKAKQAARFAAYQALNSLQTAMGPDTRVSANAKIFDHDIDPSISELEQDSDFVWWKSSGPQREFVDEVSDAQLAKNQHWLGVWDSKLGRAPMRISPNQSRSDYATATMDKAVAWLVSGNKVRDYKSNSPVKYRPYSELDDKNSIRIVSAKSKTSPEIRVPSQTLEKDKDDGDTGMETRIGWWISDESQKAPANAIASAEQVEEAKNIDYRMQSLPFFSGIHSLTFNSTKALDLTFNDESLDFIRNLNGIDDLDIFRNAEIPESVRLKNEMFHAISFNTLGVISNVRHGGLKKDLSLGLTRKDFGNETEILKEEEQSKPQYFERPYGVSGWEYNTTAYPLIATSRPDGNRVPTSSEENRILNGKGHMFAPQMFGHEKPEKIGSAVDNLKMLFDDSKLFKDPGGPMWDQLRSYYNLRVDEIASDGKISERVQTDDRFGVKPVVKRFQVFIVPSFVHYGSGRYYGVRIHIIPMLILYNPYDTKLAGNTYYAIRLSGHDAHEIGRFRLAVGYETSSGRYFQCVRDTRTEEMPSLSDKNWDSTATEANGFRYYLNFGNIRGGNARGIIGDTNYQSSFLSKKTGFYHGNSNNKFLPLGYGTNDNVNTSSNVQDSVIDSSASSYSMSSIPNKWDTFNFKTTDSRNNSDDNWKAFVTEGNLVPSLKTAYARAKNKKSYTARVAKVPLYLNNLFATVDHGSAKFMESSSRLFYPQRSIDGTNHRNVNLTDESGKTNVNAQTANLHFLAFDPDGIEPGKAKVFAMTSIVNYVGDPEKTEKGTGPNGQLELKSDEKSPYEKHGAMLCPIDGTGEYKGSLGNCFYLDVPHPEVEHQAKFSSNGLGYDNLSPYVLFDLQKVQQFKDCEGNTAPSDISDYLIDIEDGVGMRAFHTKSGRSSAYFAKANYTPIGYSIYGHSPDGEKLNNETRWQKTSYYFANQRESQKYASIDCDIWIWKREGFKFGKLSDDSDKGGFFPDMAPQLSYFKGFRLYLGETRHSFPDPSIDYKVPSNKTWGDDSSIENNFAVKGLFRYGSGSRLYSLRPPSEWYGTYDKNINDKPEEEFTSDQRSAIEAGNIPELTPESKARYFVNWLGVNPRRHSANFWSSYNGSLDKMEVGDSVPRATSGRLGDFIPEANNYDYGERLHRMVNNTRGYIPYGYVFSQPYAQNESGHEPLFNSKIFANGNILATGFDSSFNSQDLSSMARNSLGNDFGQFSKNNQAFSQVHSPSEAGDGLTDLGYTVNIQEVSYVNIGLQSKVGTTTAPLFHILRKREVVSNPADLSSVNLSFGSGKYTAGTYANDTDQSQKMHPWNFSYGLGMAESLNAMHAIGNSNCPIRIVPERSYHIPWLDGSNYIYPFMADSTSKYPYGDANGKRDEDEDRSAIYDMSWHLNNLLWDEYFFSTLPYRKDELELQSSASTVKPQNPRIVYIPSATKKSPSELHGNPDDFDENTANLMINGPFNVNSTNVDAWKVVLSGLFGQRIMSADGKEINNDSAAFTRFPAPFSNRQFTSSNSIYDETTFMQGYRKLSEEEIDELACAIVENIKDRGPFYSLSDFVNRSVTNNSSEERYTDSISEEQLLDEPEIGSDRKNLKEEIKSGGGVLLNSHMQKGVLQAAIDSTKINAPFAEDDTFIISNSNNRNMSEAYREDKAYKIFNSPKDTWENWRGAVGPQASGAPAYLMQRDILSKIGSFITVRGDTFKIRACGEIRNPVSGQVQSRSYCEMIVQRVPEYIDDKEGQEAWKTSGREREIGYQQGATDKDGNSLDEITDELTPLNKHLGRRFKIVSFRWLNDKEI